MTPAGCKVDAKPVIDEKLPPLSGMGGGSRLNRRIFFSESYGSVRFESGLVILSQSGILVFLPQIAVPDCEEIEFISHEAPESVLRRANDRFPAHVEARVHEHRAAGLPFKRRKQRVVARIGFLMHGLDAGRVVNMRN